MTWRRHAGDSKWHTGAPNDLGSFVTLCNGRWSLTSEAEGLVEHDENPPAAERCIPCSRRQLEIERAEVHTIVDNLLALDEVAGPPAALAPAQVIRIAREVRRLREDVGELAMSIIPASEPEIERPRLTAALIEAIEIAQAAGRRGLLSASEHERLRELAKVVPH